MIIGIFDDIFTDKYQGVTSYSTINIK